MLTQLVAQSFGLLIGATVMVPKTAQTITAVTMLSMMLVSACLLPGQKMSKEKKCQSKNVRKIQNIGHASVTMLSMMLVGAPARF